MDADAVIAELALEPHPEGGWYREAWRDEASTAIWFLLRSGERSRWHRVIGSAEAWHHYLGDALLLDISIDGVGVDVVTLGIDLLAGERPQAVVPAGAWQSASPVGGGARGYALVGCTVAPPFRFDAFEMAPAVWEPESTRRRIESTT